MTEASDHDVALTAREAVDFLVKRSNAITGSWVDPHGSTVAANALIGAAHDIACGCEDSTVGHLAAWAAEWPPRQSDPVEMTGDYITVTVRIPLNERFATYDELAEPADVVEFLHDEYGSPASVLCDYGTEPGAEARWECKWNGTTSTGIWPNGE